MLTISLTCIDGGGGGGGKDGFFVDGRAAVDFVTCFFTVFCPWIVVVVLVVMVVAPVVVVVTIDSMVYLGISVDRRDRSLYPLFTGLRVL